MKSNKTDKDIAWCSKQKKGLKLVKPSEDLCSVYLDKSKSSLNILKSSIEKNEIEWIATTSYYSKYFALYAFFAKLGIKCEIHDCTISAMNFLFVDSNIIEKDLYEELLESKDLRVSIQYYAYKEFDKEKVMRLANSTGDFVLEIEKVIKDITQSQIDLVRGKLQKIIKKRK